jgi:hypothetical protein
MRVIAETGGQVLGRCQVRLKRALVQQPDPTGLQAEQLGDLGQRGGEGLI